MKVQLTVSALFFLVTANVGLGQSSGADQPGQSRGLESERVELPRWHFIDRATIPDATPGMPEHVRLLYSDRVDMRAVERAFAEYYADRGGDAPFEDLERDPYAKFFNQWYRGAQDFVDDNGIVQALSTSALIAYRSTSAQPFNAHPVPPYRWEFVGPKKTLWRADHSANQPEAPWQVNIYCIDVSVTQPSLLYAGSETGALYKSVDKGINWVPLDNMNWGGAILSVAIAPSDPKIVYAATSTDIFRTTNGGLNWTIVMTQSGLSCNSLAISPSTPTTVLAGTSAGLYRTVDGGNSWSHPMVNPVDDIAYRPGDSSTVYVLQRSPGTDTFRFKKSVDGGASFPLSMNGWGTVYEQSGGRICVSQADPDYVYALLLTHDGSGNDQKPRIMKSTDSAANWVTAATGTTAALAMNNGQGYYDMDIVVSQVDPEVIIAATTTAYRSPDGGTTWSAVGGYTGPFGIHPDIQALVSVVDGTTENTWIATDGGVNFSTDFYSDPANWEPRTSGLDGTDFWGFSQGWNEDYLVGGRYHNGNTAMHESYPKHVALRLGGAESVTGWALHGRERYAAFDDISELILPENADGAPEEGGFLFTKHPQNYYYGDAFSRVMVDLEDFMTVYLGAQNSFWRSRDGGGSWEAIANFTGKPYHFDISRADGDYFYLAADDGFYRSTNRGESFTEMTLPTGLTDWHSQNLRVAASSMDRDVVWVLNQRSAGNSNSGRLFVSNNGGTSWTDLTTTMLDGRKWRALAHQAGTNGGIYIASNRGGAGTNPARVLYRDNTMSDWVDHSAGLPRSANPIKILPFYRDGKLRWGGNRGAWEIDFYEQDWAPIAQPFVSGKTQVCIRDTVEFDSYSIAKADATYSWSIPGANWTTPLDARQVHATFPATGVYTATLTVTQEGVADMKAVQVTITNGCDADSTPGNSILMAGGSGDYAATLRSPDITTNTLTMSAWIKRNGNQEPYSGIIFSRGSSSAGMNFGSGNQLGFHWNDSEWWWGSGLVPADNEWAHVAMVVSPTETKLYLNGVAATNGTNPAPFTFDSVVNFGADPNWGTRRFKGQMDEVLIYNRALSQSEIRESMHLTRAPANESDLVGYWQFNRADGLVTDRIGTNHASLLGTTTRLPSTAPVGSGESSRASIFLGVSYSFGSTGLTLEFQPLGTLPDGELVVTRIDHSPDVAPPGPISDSYWIVHNYGANSTFSELVRMTFATDLTPGQAAAPAAITLYKRGASIEGGWGTAADQAEAATAGTPGTVTFSTGNGQTTLGQYLLSTP